MVGWFGPVVQDTLAVPINDLICFPVNIYVKIYAMDVYSMGDT